LGREDGGRPRTLLLRERAARLHYGSSKQFPPLCCIVKSNSNRVLDKTRNTGRMSAGDECAHFFDLVILKRNGYLGGRHADDHTAQLCG
jgi:hypothetical protein